MSLQHVVLCPLGLYLEWQSGGVGSVRWAGCGPADGSPPGEGGSGAGCTLSREPGLKGLQGAVLWCGSLGCY